MLDASVTWEVQDNFAVFLKLLLAQNLGEEIRRVRDTRNVIYNHLSSAT